MLKFTLPIIPTAQARPRFSRWGTYKSDRQQSNESILDYELSKHTPNTPLDGPLLLEFVAVMPWPKKTKKSLKTAMLNGEELPAKKPDLDNLAKQLKDAMTRMRYWNDDSQVVSLKCSKIYAEHGRWDVKVGQVGL